MALTILSLSRRHVLGDLYPRCDAIRGDIPVYLETQEKPVMIGHVDQSLGLYADAFSFHLEPDDCKKLSAGQFSFSIAYEYSKKQDGAERSRVMLMSITLTGRKSYEKPAPKAVAAADAE